MSGTKIKEQVLVSISKELQECQKRLNKIEEYHNESVVYDLRDHRNIPEKKRFNKRWNCSEI